MKNTKSFETNKNPILNNDNFYMEFYLQLKVIENFLKEKSLDVALLSDFYYNTTSQ